MAEWKTYPVTSAHIWSYLAAMVLVPVVVAGLAIATTSDVAPVDWGSTGYALALYLLWAGFQLLVMATLKVFVQRYALAVLCYLGLLVFLNYLAFGLDHGSRSLPMFVIAAALVHLAIFALSERIRPAAA